MSHYFKTAEFWQCSVFLVWSLFELALVGVRVASVSQAGLVFGSFLLIGGALSLIKAFISVVRWRLDNPNVDKSPVARTFLYSAGTLAVALQTVWTLVLRQ
jgi:hypothetical protein